MEWAKDIPRSQYCLCDDDSSAACPQNPNIPYMGWIPAPYVAHPTSLLTLAAQPLATRPAAISTTSAGLPSAGTSTRAVTATAPTSHRLPSPDPTCGTGDQGSPGQLATSHTDCAVPSGLPVIPPLWTMDLRTFSILMVVLLSVLMYQFGLSWLCCYLYLSSGRPPVENIGWGGSWLSSKERTLHAN